MLILEENLQTFSLVLSINSLNFVHLLRKQDFVFQEHVSGFKTLDICIGKQHRNTLKCTRFYARTFCSVSIHLFLCAFWIIALKNAGWKCQDAHKICIKKRMRTFE